MNKTDMNKIERNLTTFQEQQLSYALSNEGNFNVALRVGNMRRSVSKRVIDRMFDAFDREGITEQVKEGACWHTEFTCKARLYIDRFNLQDAWKVWYREGKNE